MLARMTIYENVDLELADQIQGWMETLAGIRSPACPATGVDDARRPRERSARRHRVLRKRRPRARGRRDAASPRAGRGELPGGIRPALELQPDSVGVYEIAQRG